MNSYGYRVNKNHIKVGDKVKYHNESFNPFVMTVTQSGGDGVVRCVIGTSNIDAGNYRVEDLKLQRKFPKVF